MQRVRQANEEALRRGLLTFEESALLMKRYEEGLEGYTYLEEEDPGRSITNGSSGLVATNAQATSGAPPVERRATLREKPDAQAKLPAKT